VKEGRREFVAVQCADKFARKRGIPFDRRPNRLTGVDVGQEVVQRRGAEGVHAFDDALLPEPGGSLAVDFNLPRAPHGARIARIWGLSCGLWVYKLPLVESIAIYFRPRRAPPAWRGLHVDHRNSSIKGKAAPSGAAG
jgi:hypothetical protein